MRQPFSTRSRSTRRWTSATRLTPNSSRRHPSCKPSKQSCLTIRAYRTTSSTAIAYLQLGQDAKARALMMEAGAVNKVFRAILGSETGLAAVPARYMLERQDWRGAAGLQIPAAVNAPPAKAIIHFARALGAARSGDLAAAQTDIGNLQELKAALEKASQPYWAGQVGVQILAAQA